jgi:hypothetical protein
MAVCIGFVRSQFSKSAWTRCARPAARRGRLCMEHRDALDGALLGIREFEERQADEAQKARKRAKSSCKECSPAWDTRNAAAATTTPERLEPDPARACPAPTAETGIDVKRSRVEL